MSLSCAFKPGEGVLAEENLRAPDAGVLHADATLLHEGADAPAGVVGAAGGDAPGGPRRLAGVQQQRVAGGEGPQRPAVAVAAAPDARRLQQAAVAALPLHRDVVEDERGLLVVRPDAPHMPAVPGV